MTDQPRKKLGCFWKGCLGTVVLLILAILAIPFTRFMLLVMLGDYIPKKHQIDKHADRPVWSADSQRLYYWREDDANRFSLYRYDSTAFLWQKKRRLTVRSTHFFDIASYVVSPDERHLLYATEKQVILQDLTNGREQQLFDTGSSPEKIDHVQWCSDGKILLSSHENERVHLYLRTVKGTAIADFIVVGATEGLVIPTDDGKAFGYWEGYDVFVLRDVHAAKRLHRIRCHKGTFVLRVTANALYCQ